MFFDITEISKLLRESMPDDLTETNLYSFVKKCKSLLMDEYNIPLTHVQQILCAIKVDIQGVEITPDEMDDLTSAFCNVLGKLYQMYDELGLISDQSVHLFAKDMSLELS